MLRWTFILMGCVGFASAFATWQTAPQQRARGAQASRLGPGSGDVQNYNPTMVLRKPIRAIVDPKIASADEVSLAANALVIGVEVNGEARAYPINQLTGPMREIINDNLGGTAIATTW